VGSFYEEEFAMFLGNWSLALGAKRKMPQRDRSRFPHRRRPLLEHLESRLVPSLLINGDFEAGDFTGWTQLGDRSFTGVGGNPHGGHAAAFMGPTHGEGFLAQTFTTNPGDSYTLNYWLEHDNFSGDPNNSFHAMIDGVDIPGSVLSNAAPFGYTQYTFTFTAGPSGTTELKFGFREVPALFHLDDVSVDPGDHVVPVVVTNSLHGVFLDFIDRGRIVFNTAVNPDSPPPADEFSLRDPNGNPVNIRSLTAADLTNTVFDVIFDVQTTQGLYNVTIGPNIRDFAGNPMAAPFTDDFFLDTEPTPPGGSRSRIPGMTTETGGENMAAVPAQLASSATLPGKHHGDGGAKLAPVQAVPPLSAASAGLGVLPAAPVQPAKSGLAQPASGQAHQTNGIDQVFAGLGSKDAVAGLPRRTPGGGSVDDPLASSLWSL
jgi:hypothetical protein